MVFGSTQNLAIEEVERDRSGAFRVPFPKDDTRSERFRVEAFDVDSHIGHGVDEVTAEITGRERHLLLVYSR